MVFPQGIPVTMVDGKSGKAHDVSPVSRLPAQAPGDELDAESTKAEGGLSSEAGVMEEQARQVRPLNDGENLLKAAPATLPIDDKAIYHSTDGKESTE